MCRQSETRDSRLLSVGPPEANEISIFLASPLPSACRFLSEPFQSFPVRTCRLHGHQTTRPTLDQALASRPCYLSSHLDCTLPSRRTSLICACVSVTCQKCPGLGRSRQFKLFTHHPAPYPTTSEWMTPSPGRGISEARVDGEQEGCRAGRKPQVKESWSARSLVSCYSHDITASRSYTPSSYCFR